MPRVVHRSDSVRMNRDSGSARHDRFGRTDVVGAHGGTGCFSVPAILIGGAAVSGTALARDAEVVRRTGRLQLDAALEGLVVEPVQHLLVFLGRNHLLGGNVDTATYRNEQERVQRISAQAAREIEDLR